MSDIVNNEIDNNSHTDKEGSLGYSLKQLRKSKNLTEADIANSLRLTESKIKEIENDQFELLGGLTYAKGYIKAYANTLGADAIIYLDELDRTPWALKQASNQNSSLKIKRNTSFSHLNKPVKSHRTNYKKNYRIRLMWAIFLMISAFFSYEFIHMKHEKFSNIAQNNSTQITQIASFNHIDGKNKGDIKDGG